MNSCPHRHSQFVTRARGAAATQHKQIEEDR